MSAVLEALQTWGRRGGRVALATVVETKKSAPQPAGTKMAVNDDGDVVGAVSGGCVEGAVVEVAEGIIGVAEPLLLHYGIADSDAWDVGLPCGGEISIWVERFERDGLQARFSAYSASGTRAALVTAVAGGPRLGAKLLVTPDSAPEGTLGNPALDAASSARSTSRRSCRRSRSCSTGARSSSTLAGASRRPSASPPPSA